MRVEVDYDRCTGLGVCEALAPHLFQVTDDGSMRVVDGSPAEADRSALAEVVASCPTKAITVAD